MDFHIHSNLFSPKAIIDMMNRYQFRPKKRLGQNFLIDKNIASIIVKALRLNKEDSIFEIGTGMGSLTLSLTPGVKHIFSVEKDTRLKPILDHIVSDYQNEITIMYQDILDFDLVDFLNRKKQEGYQVRKLAGNLPYSISLPLLKKLMEMHDYLDTAVIMVQREVAERMMAVSGDKNYGVLSLVSSYYADIKKIHLVKPEAFFPRPAVDSMIVRIEFLTRPRVIIEDEDLFFDLIHAIFQHRRKSVKNALQLYFGDRLDQSKLDNSLLRIGLPLSRRGESFSLEEFSRLTSEIKKIIKCS